MSEALELLHYQSYRLLFSDETRKIMDAKVKHYLEANNVDISSFQHGKRHPRILSGSKASTSEVP